MAAFPREPGEVQHSSRDPVLIRGANVIEPGSGRTAVSSVLLSAGRVKGISPDLLASPGTKVVEANGRWLLPGWVDIQVNDIAWLSHGLKEPREHVARIREVIDYQARRGVTGLILATLAAPLEEVLSYLRGMKALLDSPKSPLDSTFLGALVEGTFMNPEMSGAQNPAWVLRPEGAVLERILDTGAVKLINIAPETSPDAIDLIRQATSRGVVVGAGHSKAHAERLREAVKAGLRYIIHLGNGPTGSSLKRFHDGGMLEESLRNDGLWVSIIMDGYHIHPRLVRDWIARKEVSRVMGTSDAGFATGIPPGEFEAFGIRGAASEDGRYLKVLKAGGAAPNPYSSDFAALFGSAVGMREVFENVVNLLTRGMDGIHCRFHPPVALGEAVAAASRICSANPAALLGLEDRGTLAVGQRADAVLAEIDGAPGAYAVNICGTWLL